jgi:ABC-type nitrate/sulfonate/bicarbonate transport system substrate-binding protein
MALSRSARDKSVKLVACCIDARDENEVQFISVLGSSRDRETPMSNENEASKRQSRFSNLSRRTLLVGAGVTGALLAGRGWTQAQPGKAGKPLRKITVGEVSRSATNWTRIVAADKGFFAEEGLSIDSIIVQGGPPAIVQQVIGGSLDVGVPNFDLVVRGIQAGAQITMIGSSMIKFPFSLVAAASIKTAADLKGKKVSVSSPRDPTTLFLSRWLRSNGMSLKDVDVLYVGATPERFAALVSGAMSAVALTQPFDFRAMEKGFNRLVDFGQISGDYGFLAFTVTRSWLQKNPDVARGFLRAVKRGSDWLHDPANKEEAINILAADIRQDKALVAKTYDYYFAELNPFSRDLSIPPGPVQGVLDAMMESKELQPPVPEVAKYIDLSYLPK